MYKIEAVVRPHLLESIREALTDAGITGLTAFDCRGAGSQPEVTHQFRGSSYGHHLAARTFVVVIVSEAHLNVAVDAIQTAGKTDEVGDGKIFVTKLEEVVRIRTNERGNLALS